MISVADQFEPCISIDKTFGFRFHQGATKINKRKNMSHLETTIEVSVSKGADLSSCGPPVPIRATIFNNTTGLVFLSTILTIKEVESNAAEQKRYGRILAGENATEIFNLPEGVRLVHGVITLDGFPDHPFGGTMQRGSNVLNIRIGGG